MENWMIDKMSRGMYGKLDDRSVRIENISNFLDDKNEMQNQFRGQIMNKMDSA